MKYLNLFIIGSIIVLLLCLRNSYAGDPILSEQLKGENKMVVHIVLRDRYTGEFILPSVDRIISVKKATSGSIVKIKSENGSINTFYVKESKEQITKQIGELK